MQSITGEQYSISIPNDKAATYKVVTFIIAFINVAAFSYICFNEINQSRLRFAILGAILSGTALIFYMIKNNSRQLPTFKIEVAFILLAIIWFICGDFWLGLPMLIFGIVGIYTNKQAVVRFNETGILYPSFPPRLYKWAEVDFVILKDGILTIELVNNRVLQFTLPPANTQGVTEVSFNEYCRSQRELKSKQ